MTSEGSLSSGPGVLIVDPSADCREVLATLLRRRGMRTWEAAEARQGLDMMRRHHPDVIVLDMDSGSADDESVQRQYDCESRRERAAVIFLGVAPQPNGHGASGHAIAKPYHYAPLIRTIERMLRR